MSHYYLKQLRVFHFLIDQGSIGFRQFPNCFASNTDSYIICAAFSVYNSQSSLLNINTFTNNYTLDHFL